MEGRSALKGFGHYLGWLLSVIVFPIAWLRMRSIVAQHKRRDPRGAVRLLASFAVALAITAGGANMFYSFHQENIDGMYDSLDNRLSIATGNEEYKAFASEGDDQNASMLEANHDLYTAVSSLLEDRNDVAAKALIAQHAGLREDLDVRSERAFAAKDKAVDQLDQIMVFLVYPGLIGMFFAPVVWAGGKSINRAFSPSTSVGFKTYPSTAMALFLLLGGFGIPAVFFAAWSLKDIDDRTTEGQIAL